MFPQFSEIGPLSLLTNLKILLLNSNQIVDIEPLVENTGLGSGDKIELKTNPLSDTSIDVYIPQLRSRGVSIEWE